MSTIKSIQIDTTEAEYLTIDYGYKKHINLYLQTLFESTSSKSNACILPLDVLY